MNKSSSLFSADRTSAGLGGSQNRSLERPPTATNRPKILLVDDTPEKTLALQSIITELDYEVVVATSAKAGLRELLRQDFVLALLDVQMPGMDGFEMAKLIRSRPAHDHLTIVFMSSLDQSDERLERAYTLGAIDFISLPARRPIIKGKLSAILGLQKETRRLETAVDEKARRLEETEERFRLLLENAEDLGMCFLDTAGRVMDWSRGAELCTGWAASEMTDRFYGVLFTPGDVADHVPEKKLSEARAGHSVTFDHWFLRKDGSRFWGRAYVVELRGKPTAGFAVMLRDISAARVAEQELQIKAEVLESMSESVCVVDEGFRIVYANPAAERAFGYPVSELIGLDKRLLNDYSPEENAARIEMLLAHFVENRSWTGEWHNRRKDGSRFVTHTHLSRLEFRGTKYFVCVQEDITERKHAQAALQRSAELQEVVGELEAFTYSVSHDLRAPLRTVKGFADTVLQDYGDALQGPGVQYMERIRNAADRLERLVEDILAFSRLPREKLVLLPVDVAHIVSSILEETPSFRPPQACIVISGTLPVVMAHEPSLRQVFFNLLGNAVKFVPKGRTPVVNVRAETAETDATIWVEDNGIGLRPEDHARIFRVFERVANSEGFPGTGVGLAIVRRTIERLGGSVGVESTLGGGSKFWIKLRTGTPS
jgi:PAS domain S-box-containing protein